MSSDRSIPVDIEKMVYDTVYLSVSEILDGISDHDLTALLEAARESGLVGDQMPHNLDDPAYRLDAISYLRSHGFTVEPA